MKILIILEGFFPGKKYGGPPVSVDNFCKLMVEEDCYIYTLDHEMGSLEPYDSVESNIWLERKNYHIKYVSQKNYCNSGFKNAIKEVKPDLLYLQGLFQSCVLPCLKLAQRMNIKVLLAPRGELCAGAFKKKYKKIPYICYLRVLGLLKNVYFQSTSEEEYFAINKILGVSRIKIFNLTNIPSISGEMPERKAKKTGEAKFLFLARIHPKKNLLVAIKFFNKVVGDVKFDIYGPIEDQNYWIECQNEIKKLPQNVKVRYMGIISHDAVHDIFRQYDALVFPTLSENYGHVIAEALVVGTPVIISDQTPWTNINQYNAGWALPLKNVQEFIAAIQTIIDAHDNRYCANALLYANKMMNFEEVKRQYEDVLITIIKK